MHLSTLRSCPSRVGPFERQRCRCHAPTESSYRRLDIRCRVGHGFRHAGHFCCRKCIGSVGPASAEDLAASRVQDTSEMVAAITNAKHKQSDPEFAAIPRSRCSLERLTGHLLKDHPVLSCVVGNSGNAADVSHNWRFSHKRSFPDLLSVTSGQNGVFPSQ